MNQRYDDQDFSRNERERERDRERERNRHSEDDRHRGASRDSFHPGGYGFEDVGHAERGGSRDYSQPYGQREPYTPSSGGSTRYGDDDARRDYGRGDWSGRPNVSRYSESQYGQRQFARDRYESPPEDRWGGTGYGGDHRGYGGAQGYSPPRDDWRRSRSYGAGAAGSGDDYMAYGNRGSYEHRGRYDTQSPGGVGHGGERRFGQDVFGAPTDPAYFGTGSYGDGGVGFAGGYGDERSRWASSGYGEYQGPERSGGARQYGGGHGGGESYGGGRKPGLLSRLFGRGPKGYQRSDERLREDISERLLQAGNIDSSEVTVTVVGGAVTLEGTVPDRYMKHYIEDLADACPGVQDIDNRIRVDRNFGSRGNDEWARSSGSSGQAQIGATGAMAGGAGTSMTGTGTTGTSGTATGTSGTSGTAGSSSSSGALSSSGRRKDS